MCVSVCESARASISFTHYILIHTHLYIICDLYILLYCTREEIFFSLFFNKRLIVNHKFFAAVYMTRTQPTEHGAGCSGGLGNRRICEIVAHHFRPAAAL